ncbi:hypothetical protein F8745_00610 [Salmonella enterica]|nr:hypothetical protein [Salmonella enterica]
MPEKVTSYGLKVTSEYCSYNYGAHNVLHVMLKRPLRKSNPAAAFLHITSLCAVVHHPSHLPRLSLLFTALIAANTNAAITIVFPVSRENRLISTPDQNKIMLHKFE